MRSESELPPDVFDADGLERVLECAERDPAASEELDLVTDIVAAAELERARLSLRRAPAAAASALPFPSWTLAAAASVLFALALGLWYFRSGGERASRSLASLAAPRYVAVELRGDDPTLAEDFARAMEPYARGDWRGSASAIDAFLERHPEHGPARFYLAASWEQLGDLARAEREYERATASPDALLAGHARLRLALRLYARGERAQARAALTARLAEEGERAPGAREWLERLEW